MIKSDLSDALLQGETATTPAMVLELFDRLESVDIGFMMGRWRGREVRTHHPLEGLLAASGWYGKEFIDPDTVHPLLCLDSHQNLFKVAPNPMALQLGLNLPLLRHEALRPIARLVTRLAKTDHSQARVRMMEYRQKISATLIYDSLPIHDVFRKIDNNSVLGLMDFKGIPEPFFFILQRDPLPTA